MRTSKLLFKLALLSISLITGSATAITGMLSILGKEFPQVSQSMLESLITLPSLTTLVFTLLSSSIAKKIGHKRTVQTGILLAAVTGIGPFFLDNFTVILGLRLLFGVGIGMVTPLAISLISMFFYGDERAALLGFQVGTTALGNALLILISGVLLRTGWNWGFLVYLALIPVLFLFSWVVPEPEQQEETLLEKVEGASEKINKRIFSLLILCFFTFLVIWAVQIKLPLLFNEAGIGDASSASLTLSLMNLGGLLAGLLFGKLFVRFRAWLLPVSYILAGLSTILLSRSSQFWTAASLAIFFNFIYSFTGPYIITKVNQASARSLLTLSTALISLSMTASQFLTPFFWNNFGKIFGDDSAQSVTFLAGMLALIIGCFLSVRLLKRSSKTTVSKEAINE